MFLTAPRHAFPLRSPFTAPPSPPQPHLSDGVVVSLTCPSPSPSPHESDRDCDRDRAPPARSSPFVRPLRPTESHVRLAPWRSNLHLSRSPDPQWVQVAQGSRFSGSKRLLDGAIDRPASLFHSRSCQDHAPPRYRQPTRAFLGGTWRLDRLMRSPKLPAYTAPSLGGAGFNLSC